MPIIVARVWTKYSWWLGVIMTAFGSLPITDQQSILTLFSIPIDRQIAVLGVILLVIRSIQQPLAKGK